MNQSRFGQPPTAMFSTSRKRVFSVDGASGDLANCVNKSTGCCDKRALIQEKDQPVFGHGVAPPLADRATSWWSPRV